MPERPHVFVTRSLPGDALGRLSREVHLDLWEGSRPPLDRELRERTVSAQGLLCLLTDRIDAALLAACPELVVVSSCSVGVDHIDLRAAASRGISVGHTPGVLAETTADLAFGLLLASARRIPEADRFVRQGGWTPQRSWEPDLLLGRDVHGASLGIVGLGEVGRAVARRAAGFGMKISGWSRSGWSVDGVDSLNLDALLESAEFLTVHLARTPETLGLIDAAALRRLPPGAILVNTARGGIVDEEALVAALESGQLAGAALDVFASEPIALDSPLLRMENVVLTPHIGSASFATRARMADLAVDNLLAGLEGRELPHAANRRLAHRRDSAPGTIGER